MTCLVDKEYIEFVFLEGEGNQELKAGYSEDFCLFLKKKKRMPGIELGNYTFSVLVKLLCLLQRGYQSISTYHSLSGPELCFLVKANEVACFVNIGGRVLFFTLDACIWKSSTHVSQLSHFDLISGHGGQKYVTLNMHCKSNDICGNAPFCYLGMSNHTQMNTFHTHITKASKPSHFHF